MPYGSHTDHIIGRLKLSNQIPGVFPKIQIGLMADRKLSQQEGNAFATGLLEQNATVLFQKSGREFLGGTVERTWRFHCHGLRVQFLVGGTTQFWKQCSGQKSMNEGINQQKIKSGKHSHYYQ